MADYINFVATPGVNTLEFNGTVNQTGPPGPTGATGVAGPTGPTGSTGAAGAPGVGVATGGTTGQILAKNSNTNYDTGWVDGSTFTTPDATFSTAGKVKKTSYNAKDYGLVADAIKLTDAAITSGSAVLTSALGVFLSTDVGKSITVIGAAASGDSLRTTILSWQSSTQVTLATSASTTVTGGVYFYGTANSTFLQNAMNATAATGGTLELGGGNIYLNAHLFPASNVRIRGLGKGLTNLYGGNAFDYMFYTSGSSPINSFILEDLTLDLCNLYRASGVNLYNANYCYFNRVAFINGASNGWLAKLGVASGATSSVLCESNYFIDCDFDTHTGTLEMLLIFNTNNTQIIRPRLLNKSSGPGIGLWQKCYGTRIMQPYFYNLSQGVYYSITVEDTVIADAYGMNVHQPILGSNTSDNGNFGLTQAQDLKIYNPQFYGGTLGSEGVGIQLGSVNNVSIINPTIKGFTLGIAFNKGNNSNTMPATNWSIIGGEIYDGNPDNNSHAIHGGIAFSAVGGTMYGLLFGTKIYDDRGTQYQRYPIDFTGAFTWDAISIISNRLSADTASGGTSIKLGTGSVLGSNVRIANNQDFSGTNPSQTVGGDVGGPSSATDNAIARFDGTTGKVIQDSGITIDDNGQLSLAPTTTTYPIDVNQLGTSGTRYMERFRVGSANAFTFRRNSGADGTNGNSGFTDLRIEAINTGGSTTNAAVPIVSLIGPDGIQYADWTYNGQNMEIEVSSGDMNIRTGLANGGLMGNVNIWSLQGSPKLRIGDNGFNNAMDLQHTGQDGYISTTTGNVRIPRNIIVGQGYAASLAGTSSSYIDAGNNSALQLAQSGAPFSLSCRFQIDASYAFGHDMYLFSKNSAYSMRVSSTRHLCGNTQGSTDVVNSTTLVAGTTYHAVVTYDETNIKLYLNGTLVNTVATVSSGVSNINNLFIGKKNGTASSEFFGVIDNVRAWNRAITSTEVTQIYNDGVAPSSGLVLEMGFDTQTTLDTSATANTTTPSTITYVTGLSAPLYDSSALAAFIGLVKLTSLRVTGGTPAIGKVLTSDASGNATWQTPASGSFTRTIINVTSTVTGAAVAKTDYVYLIGASGVYTQPTAVSNTNRYTLKNVDTSNKTVAFTGAETADGSTTVVLTPNTSLDLISDNTNWRII